MMKHQYGFAVMNGNTGGCRRKAFWALEQMRKNARKMHIVS